MSSGEHIRERLPDERMAVTHKFTIFGADKSVDIDEDGNPHVVMSDIDGYLTAGIYDDGKLGEVFLSIGKQGGPTKAFECLMIAVSIGLQYGIPLSVFVEKFRHMSFEPSGVTNNSDIQMSKSIADYIFQWLDSRFPGGVMAGFEKSDSGE